jgi:hypothetical protein
MASSLGKMPTTSVRRLISPLKRSIGLVECSLVRCCGGKGHVGEHIGLGLVEEVGKLGQLGAELVGNLPPLRSCGLGILLGKRGGNEGGDDAPVAA